MHAYLIRPVLLLEILNISIFYILLISAEGGRGAAVSMFTQNCVYSSSLYVN